MIVDPDDIESYKLDDEWIIEGYKDSFQIHPPMDIIQSTPPGEYIYSKL